MSATSDNARYWIERCRDALDGADRPVHPSEPAPAPAPDEAPNESLFEDEAS